MVFLHNNFFVDSYLKYVNYKRSELNFHLKVFIIFAFLFLFTSMALTITDILFIQADLGDHRKTELTLFLGLALFFDILKIYYISIDAYIMMIIMALTSLILTFFVLKKTKNVNKENIKKIRSLAELVIVFLILSLISSTIYHVPTFKSILFDEDKVFFENFF